MSALGVAPCPIVVAGVFVETDYCGNFFYILCDWLFPHLLDFQFVLLQASSSVTSWRGYVSTSALLSPWWQNALYSWRRNIIGDFSRFDWPPTALGYLMRLLSECMLPAWSLLMQGLNDVNRTMEKRLSLHTTLLGSSFIWCFIGGFEESTFQSNSSCQLGPDHSSLSPLREIALSTTSCNHLSLKYSLTSYCIGLTL